MKVKHHVSASVKGKEIYITAYNKTTKCFSISLGSLVSDLSTITFFRDEALYNIKDH